MNTPESSAGNSTSQPVSVKDALSSLNESSKHAGTLLVTLVLTAAYLAITTLGTTHLMLLRKSSLKLPVVDLGVPMTHFYFVAPLILLAIHGYTLLSLYTIGDRLRKSASRQPGWKTTFWPLIYPSLAMLRFLARFIDRWRVAILLRFLFFSLLFAPLPVLLLLQGSFLPYQHDWLHWFHFGAVFLDSALLFALWPPRIEEGPWVSVNRFFGLILLALAVFASLLLVAVVPDVEVTNCAALREHWPPRYLSLQGQDASEEAINLDRRSLRCADLRGVRFGPEASFRGADLRGSLLQNAVLRRADFSPAGLDEWHLAHAPGEDKRRLTATISPARLTEPTRLDGAILDRAHIEQARLLFAKMSRSRLYRTDLRGAELTGSNLSSAVLRDARLIAADLSSSNLSLADFQGADLTAANLSRSVGIGTRFNIATMPMSDLRQASLKATEFVKADLRGAFFASPAPRPVPTELQASTFLDADLQGSEGLTLYRTILRFASIGGACFCKDCPVDVADLRWVEYGQKQEVLNLTEILDDAEDSLRDLDQTWQEQGGQTKERDSHPLIQEARMRLAEARAQEELSEARHQERCLSLSAALQGSSRLLLFSRDTGVPVPPRETAAEEAALYEDLARYLAREACQPDEEAEVFIRVVERHLSRALSHWEQLRPSLQRLDAAGKTCASVDR